MSNLINSNTESLKSLKPVSKTFLIIIIVALSIAAAFGIWILLFGGEMGEIQTKVLFTTLIVAALSAVCLIAFSSFSKSPKVFGIIAIVLGTIGSLIVLVRYIWFEDFFPYSSDVEDLLIKIILLVVIWTIVSLHAALIFGMELKANLHRVLISVLIVSTVAVGLMFSIPLIFELNPEDLYFRIVFTLIILIVLLTVLLPILVAFSKQVTVPNKNLLHQLEYRATTEGKSVDQLLEELLNK